MTLQKTSPATTNLNNGRVVDANGRIDGNYQIPSEIVVNLENS